MKLSTSRLRIPALVILGIVLAYTLLVMLGLVGSCVGIDTDSRVYKPGDKAKVTVYSVCLVRVELGREYTVYKWEAGMWVRDDSLTPDAWTMELVVLGPGGSWSQTIDLAGVEPGVYKIVKKVMVAGDSRIIEVVFKVEK